MRNDARIAILVCAALGALAGDGGVARAQTPTPPACAHPNVPAATIRAVEPATPPLAAQQGIEGTVQVVVSLDADSHVVGTRIQSSPSAILNAAALAAARESTFRSEIRDCRPIAADYIYSVEFDAGARITTTSTGERIVTVTGSGTAMRPADSAHVIATITTQDDTPAGASAKNDAVFTALKAKLARFDMIDGGVRMTPPRPLAQTAAAPFAATRRVEIPVGVSNAVHIAVAAATVASVTVGSIRYELIDSATAYRDAMSRALKDGGDKAQGAVRMERLRLGALKQVVVPPLNTQRNPFVFVRFDPAGGSTEPDIKIPEVPVRVNLTVIYAVMP